MIILSSKAALNLSRKWWRLAPPPFWPTHTKGEGVPCQIERATGFLKGIFAIATVPLEPGYRQELIEKVDARWF